MRPFAPPMLPLLCALLAGVGSSVLPLTALGAPPKGERPPASADAADAPSPEEDANIQRAREAYQLGTQLYNDAEFEAALEAFQEAATLYASPDFQFNIAKCYERLGNYQEAIRHYDIYLRTTEDSGDHAVIEASIVDLEQRIVDQQAREEAERQAAADAADAAARAPAKPSKPLIITGAVLTGLGVAVSVGGGLGFGLPVARDNASIGEVLSGNPDGLTFAEADLIATRAQRNQAIELTMIGVGAAVAVTGAVLLAVGMKRKRSSVAPEASSHIRLSPYANTRGAGLTFGGQF